ncbi:MAG: hypothetical protein OSB83_17110 [Planctomycetota bacterium]|nr:hypothetical protein [Planctomycetota bacterium]
MSDRTQSGSLSAVAAWREAAGSMGYPPRSQGRAPRQRWAAVSGKGGSQEGSSPV